MEAKNRFSKLLEHLIATAEVKHLILAQTLQFDVSYISKWVSGKVLPAEKTVEETIQKLCACLIMNASQTGQEKLCLDYQVNKQQDLLNAMYDNLLAEYRYVQELQQQNGNNVAPMVSYYPEISMKKFLSKMNHPVLRRVKSLKVMAAMDLFVMDGEYRMQIASLNAGSSGVAYAYPEVHFSLLINLDKAKDDLINNTLFLTSMLVSLENVDFQLYQGDFARGKAVLAVSDEFSISGMLVRRDTCASVAICEGADYTGPLYNAIQSFCTREALVFRKVHMKNLLEETMGYIHSLLSPNRRWIVAQITEHFLPDDLFQELVDSSAVAEAGYDKNTLLHIHRLIKVLLKEEMIQVLVDDMVISDFVVSGEVDFFNLKINVNYEQRAKVMEYLLHMLHVPSNTEVRMIRKPLSSDFQNRIKPSMFLSSSRSYVRIRSETSFRKQTENSVLRIIAGEMQNLCEQFFESIWNKKEVLLCNHEEVENYLQHHVQNLRILKSLPGEED